MQCNEENTKQQEEMTAVNGLSQPALISLPISYTSGTPV
jgi:hypothetical protein